MAEGTYGEDDRGQRWNFVLFNPDEWRAESAGCYGHPVVETPNLDRLAREGVRFDQCHVQHTVCTPSRCSFVTGWYPHVRGHRTLWHALRPDEPNLFRYLLEEGYEVRMYGKNDMLSPESFATSVSEAGSRGRGGRHGSNPFREDDPRYWSFLYTEGGEPEEHHDFSNLEAGLEFLRSAHERPFCLFLPLSCPHPPYSAPEGFHNRYRPEMLPPLRPVCDTEWPRFRRGIRESRRLNELDADFFRTLQAVYLGMVSYTDWLLGRLLTTLDETGLADTTVVIAFSDHGDWAGDYGLVEKWPSGLDDTLTRVPFVVRLPGGARGHVVREVVELLDLTPTVLDLAGIPLRHTQFGWSLVPQLRGAAGASERAAFAEGGYDPHEPHCFEGHAGGEQILRAPGHIYAPKAGLQQRDPFSVCRSVMVRTNRHKMIVRSFDRWELYDLEQDPLELMNRIDDPEHAGVRRELEHLLLGWYLRTSDVTPWNEDPRGYIQPLVGERHRASMLSGATGS
ncbi:MAG: sulfatase-like hydrolase/transferase [Chloroflexi bacterium]|nr:sulfatase-like hydrolase/transferase [Chloroflexota bacterium]